MTHRIVSKKGFLAIFSLLLCIRPSSITAAASSVSDGIETAQATLPEPRERIAVMKESQIHPFLVQRTPKSFTQISRDFAQRRLAEIEYHAALDTKYRLPKEPARDVPAVLGHCSLRHKTIGRLFQEYKKGKYSFDDLFAIAWHQNSLSQLASLVYFDLNKDTNWDDKVIRGEVYYQFIHPWESKMRDYPDKLAPYLRLSLKEYIAHGKAPRVTNSQVDLQKSNLSSLEGIEALPGIENLLSLNASDNQLTTLPNSIEILSKLETLGLSGNKFITLPDAIGDLAQLKYILLVDNRLVSLPDTIKNLTKLEGINLHKNNFSETEIHRIREIINQATTGECHMEF